MMDLDHIKKTFVLARQCPTGVACVWSLIRYNYGNTTPWLISEWSETVKGVAKIGGLLKALRLLGFEAITRRLTMNQLERIVFPVIIFVEKDDGVKGFVVCYGSDGRRFLVGDTSWGLNQYYPEEMEAMWIGGITLDLFAGERFPSKEDHRKALKELMLRLIRGGAECRNKLLKDWIRESACDCEKDIRWIRRILPWFCIWGILNLVFWIVGVDYSLYEELYPSLWGWGGILVSAGILYKLAIYWRDKLGVHNWGRLKNQDEIEMGRNISWNWRVGSWAIIISSLLALSGCPDIKLGIGIGAVSLSIALWVSVFIRIKEVVYIIYWVFVEAQKREESKPA